MAYEIDPTETDNPTSPRVPFQLRLRSATSTRQTFASVLRAYGRGEIPQDVYRQLVWGLSQFLSAFRLERDLAIEERLDAIEAAIDRREVAE